MADLAERVPMTAVWDALPVYARIRLACKACPEWAENFDVDEQYLIRAELNGGWWYVPVQVRRAVIRHLQGVGDALELVRTRG